MNPKPVLNLVGDRMHALPLLVVYLTDGCNSQCVTCGIWQRPRRNMPLALAERLAAEFQALGVREVLLSGGEAMQHPDWPRIARLFGQAGARVLLLTNGLLLKKRAAEVAGCVAEVTISLDAATPQVYEAIRGVDALDLVLEGVRAVRALGVPVTTRTTVQRANYHQLPDIVRLGRQLGVQRVSFLAVDVKSAEAFGPRDLSGAVYLVGGRGGPNGHGPPAQALSRADLTRFEAVLKEMETEFAAEFASGFIAEPPAKLRRLRDYFAALLGEGELTRPRCNAPHISAVVEVDGRLRPCYFLPLTGRLGDGGSLRQALNGAEAAAMRRAYRAGQRPECAGCVCPLYRGPRSLLKHRTGKTGAHGRPPHDHTVR